MHLGPLRSLPVHLCVAVALMLGALGCRRGGDAPEPTPRTGAPAGSTAAPASPEPGPAAAAPRAPAASPGELVVFAAASLRDVFVAVGADFERAHAGVEVVFNFAGSQELRTQIEQGAPADVFASADARQMDALAAAALVESPAVFAHNELVLVVTPEASGAVRAFSDLPRAERIVLGAPEVPVGRYADTVLERADAAYGSDFRARVLARVVSRELNVRQVLAKVTLGEADAGVVYRTDARGAPGAVAIEVPPTLNVTAAYMIARVAPARRGAAAQAWIDAVRGPAAAEHFRRFGFTHRAGP